MPGKDLSTLGFGPPELGAKEGNCDNGHPWSEHGYNDRRSGETKCRVCRQGRQAQRDGNLPKRLQNGKAAHLVGATPRAAYEKY